MESTTVSLEGPTNTRTSHLKQTGVTRRKGPSATTSVRPPPIAAVVPFLDGHSTFAMTRKAPPLKKLIRKFRNTRIR